MQIREVQTSDGTRWQCVEAMISDTSNNESASKSSATDTVTVVCTPSGGAQTVRMDLNKDWKKSVTDEELIQQIDQKKG